jgi:hypothetical protein
MITYPKTLTETIAMTTLLVNQLLLLILVILNVIKLLIDLHDRRERRQVFPREHQSDPHERSRAV